MDQLPAILLQISVSLNNLFFIVILGVAALTITLVGGNICNGRSTGYKDSNYID
jgi:hypothetical protein